MAQKNRANMLTDIVSNIYNNLINFITGQNAQDRFVNLLDSSPNILSDASQPNGYVSTDANNEMFSSYYNENDSRANIITKSVAGSLVANKFYQINDAVGGTIALQVCAENSLILHNFAIDVQTGEIGTYDITTDVFSPIVSSAQTLAQTLILGNTSGANDIEFDATQGLLFDNASRLREGTIDAGLGGLKGIAQICGAGYELKWENGRLYVMGSSGNTIRQSLYNLTTTPTVTDDDTLGYAIGSLWTLDDGTVYVCSDATTGAAVWAIGGIPNLQQVTTAGNTTTVGITVDNGAGESIDIKHDSIKIVNALGAEAVIVSPTLATTTNFEIPNKLGGIETFAMLSDITGGGDVYLANDQTFTGENTFAIGSGNDTPVTITKGGSNAALKVTKSSGSGDAIEVADGSVSIADETASTIAHFDGSKRIKSLSTATYPSLTELSYVKGVGSQVVGTTDTNTLTNKRITARTGTVASAATPTINTDNVDYYSITALAAAITSFTTNLSGTPTTGQTLWISIKDNGTARAIAWGASFEASTIALPTTTVISTRLDVAFIWNEATSVWRCVGVA
jgi:hypothetical protein